MQWQSVGINEWNNYLPRYLGMDIYISCNKVYKQNVDLANKREVLLYGRG